MSFFSDIFHGNWDNLGHDLSADPWGTAAGVAAVALPFLAPAILPTLGAGLGFEALAGGAELGAEAGAGGGFFSGLFGGGETALGATEGGFFGGLGNMFGSTAGESALTGASGADALFGGAAADTLGAAPSVTGTSLAGPAATPISGGTFADAWGQLGVGFTDPTSAASVSGLPTGSAELPFGTTSTELFGPSTGFDVPGAGFGQNVIPTQAANFPTSFLSSGDLSSLEAMGTPGANAGADVSGGVGGFSGTTPASLTESGPLLKEPSGGFLSDLGKGAVNQVTKNPLTTAAALGGLGFSMMQGQSKPPNMENLQREASSMSAQGEQLRQYLQSGQLPPGLQASMKQATDAAKAKIISTHASRGMPTDPTHNSALAQELAAVDQQALATQGQIANQLLTTGINESGLASNIYEKLINIDVAQSKQVGDAIGNFAKALGGGGGINLKLA